MAEADITHIGQLTSDPKNARKHNPRNIGMIADALNEVGAARSIVIDEHGRILAGNGTIDAAAQAGIERVRVVETDGNEIVAVMRSGLTEKAKTRLALYDNRTAETAEWDVDVLADLNTDAMLEGMFRTDEIDRILGQYEPIDPNELWKGMPEFEQDDLGAWKSIHVHFANKDDYEAFSRLVNQTMTEKTKSIWYPMLPNSPYKNNGVIDEP